MVERIGSYLGTSFPLFHEDEGSSVAQAHVQSRDYPHPWIYLDTRTPHNRNIIKMLKGKEPSGVLKPSPQISHS